MRRCVAFVGQLCDEARVIEQSHESHAFETMRRAMVSNQLRTTAVNDERVVAAMGAIARERFVPAARRGIAYVDTLVPLDGGRMLNAPMVTGRLLTEARPRPGERALVVGAATGYAAAVLERLVAVVIALEEASALAAVARAEGLTVVEGPLAAGWASGAPYDLILVDGAIERVPDALVAQLVEGGRLATGIVERGLTRLAIGVRTGGGFGLTSFAEADAARLPGFAAPAGFVF